MRVLLKPKDQCLEGKHQDKRISGISEALIILPRTHGDVEVELQSLRTDVIEAHPPPKRSAYPTAFLVRELDLILR